MSTISSVNPCRNLLWISAILFTLRVSSVAEQHAVEFGVRKERQKALKITSAELLAMASNLVASSY